MLWFVFALLSVLFSVSFALLSRVLCVNSQNPRAFSVLFSLFAALISLVFLLFEPFYANTVTLTVLICTFLATVLYGLTNRTQFYASKYLEASTKTLIQQLSPVVSLLVSFLVLQEEITATKLAAIGLILAGNLLAVYKNNSFHFNQGVMYAVIAAVTAGLAGIADKLVSGIFSLPMYAVMVYGVTGIYNLLLLSPLRPREIMREYRLHTWKLVLLSACMALSYFFVLQAFRLAEASKVITVTSTANVFTVLLGILVLKERSRPVPKLIAMVLIFAGIYLINL